MYGLFDFSNLKKNLTSDDFSLYMSGFFFQISQNFFALFLNLNVLVL